MSPPSIAYDISDLVPGTKLQAVGHADRPLSAFTAAVASWVRGQKMRGAWSTFPDEAIELESQMTFRDSDVPQKRAELWVRGLNLERPTLVPAMTLAGGIIASDYQCDALGGLTVAGGVLALDVGLGKTVTAVTGALNASWGGLAARSRCWILAPLNAMGAWTRYLADLRSEFDEVNVLSVDSAHKMIGTANTGGVLIIDEAHMLGAMDSRRTKAAHALRPLFDVCFCLTGTLLHGGVEKCLSILDLAVPGAACFGNRWAAGEHFRCLSKYTIGRRTVTKMVKPEGVARDRFLDYLSRYCVSLNKGSPNVRDIADIPPQELVTTPVNKPWLSLDKATAQIVDEILAAGEELPHAAAVMHTMAREGIQAKIDSWRMNEFIKNDVKQPWVLFAHYRESLDQIEAFIEGCGDTYVRVDGSTPASERAEAERKFQAGEVQFFIGQNTAAGVAINLFRAHLSATFDRSWKAVDYSQLLGRTCRRGQTEDCTHYDYVANTLQEAIVDRLRDAADFNADVTTYQDIKRALGLSIAAVMPGVVTGVMASLPPLVPIPPITGTLGGVPRTNPLLAGLTRPSKVAGSLT